MFDVLNVVVLLLALAVVTVLPLLYVLAGSFATESEIDSRPFFLWPEKFVTDTYDYIFSTDTFIRALLTTIGVTAVGTVVQVLLTLTMAYPLAKRHLPGRDLLLNLVIFTLVFSGGMIPTYLVVRELGLLDSYWALILPLAINPFYLIIVKSFFQELPEALRGGGADRRLQRARRVLADRAAAVQADHRDVLAVLRGRPSGTTTCRRCSTSTTASKWTLQMFVRQLTAPNSDSANMLDQLEPAMLPRSRA